MLPFIPSFFAVTSFFFIGASLAQREGNVQPTGIPPVPLYSCTAPSQLLCCDVKLAPDDKQTSETLDALLVDTDPTSFQGFAALDCTPANGDKACEQPGKDRLCCERVELDGRVAFGCAEILDEEGEDQ